MKHIITVGAGQVGVRVVTKLRERGFDGRISLFERNPYVPRQSAVTPEECLSEDSDVANSGAIAEEFFADRQIDLRLGERVDSVDPLAKSIGAGPEKLDYDELVLATGARPLQLPIQPSNELEGIYVIKELDDIKDFSARFVRGNHMTIVGGGFLGLEVAAIATQKGLRVTLVEEAKRIAHNVVSAEVSSYLRGLHTRHHVEIMEDLSITQVIGKNRIIGTTLSNGITMSVNFMVVCLGSLPRTELAEMAGAQIDDGISIDAFGRTSVPGIWAAGDCTSFLCGEKRLRIERGTHTTDHAECVAENLTGGNRSIREIPELASSQYDACIQILGNNQSHDKVLRNEIDANTFSSWHYGNGKLLAVQAVNAEAEIDRARALIET